jgi:hypothetical protein
MNDSLIRTEVAVATKEGVAASGLGVCVGRNVGVSDGGIEVNVGDGEVEVKEGMGGLSGRTKLRQATINKRMKIISK